MTGFHLHGTYTAAIHELEACDCLFRVNGIRKRLQPGNELVVPACGLPNISLAFSGFIHVHALHKAHTAGNTLCPAPHVLHIRIRHKSVVPVQIVLCGGILDPVWNEQIPYLDRTEQMGIALRPGKG